MHIIGLFSGPDGSIQPFVRNILSQSNQSDDRFSVSTMDPRDIEVCHPTNTHTCHFHCIDRDGRVAG